MRPVHVVQDPLPEAHGLGVGVVDPEDRDPVRDPHLDDRADRVVDPLRVVVEVQGVDVLVLLRRVLRVGDRPVGPGGEPLRVLGHPRVVGRALERQVEGDLHPQGPRARHEGVEGLEAPQVRVDGVVAALGRSDPVGGARIPGPRFEGVVLALPVGRADRMDRREVHHVEAHGGDARQVLGRRAQRARHPGAVRALEGPLGAREDLVPRPGQGQRAGDSQRVGAGRAHQVAQRGVPEDDAHP